MSEIAIVASAFISAVSGFIGYHIGYMRGDFMGEWARREYSKQWDKVLMDAGRPLSQASQGYRMTDIAEEWQPIDTVPADGTRVLLYDPRRGSREGNRPAGHNFGMWTWRVFSKRKAWWTGHEFSDRYDPTHWMHLPPPPPSANSKSEEPQ